MNEERLLKVLLAPIVTEKSTYAADTNKQFVFRVIVDATKRDIKLAVELMFKVKVESVRTLNVKGKKKMFSRMPGQRSNWKKAYVSLQDGFDIEIASA